MNLPSKSLAFFLLGLIFANVAFQQGIVDVKLMIVSCLVLLNFGIGVAIVFLNKKQPALQYLQLSVIVLCLLSILFPFEPSNPFTLFSIQSAKILLLVILSLSQFLLQKNENLDDKIVYYLSLGILIFTNTYYILFDWRPMPSDDIARHSGNALKIFDLLKGDLAGKFFLSISFYDFYQPLTYLVSLPFVLVFGKSSTSLTLSFSIFWLPLGFYFLHKYLYKFVRISHVYATVICFCLFGCVMAGSMIKQYMLDFPCLCMVIVYNYALARSYYLKYTKPSWIAGIIFGLGILTKASFLSLAAIPLLIAIIRMCVKEYKNKFREIHLVLTNILVHVAGIFIGGGFWYIVNLPHFSYELPTVTTWFGEHEGDPIPTSFASIIWYFERFFYYFSPPIFVLMLIGLFISFFHLKKKFYFNMIFLLSILLAYTTATLTWNKDNRTLLPLIGYFPIAFIGLFNHLPYKKLILWILFFLVGWTFIYNFKYSTGKNYPISPALMPVPYTMPDRLISPEENDNNEATYLYRKLFSESYTDSIVPPLNIPSDLNNFNINYFGSLYPGKSYASQQVGNNKIYFFRDHFWRDYYLYSIKLDSLKHLEIEEKASHFLIRGDMICTVVLVGKSGGQTVQEYPILLNSPKIKLTLPDSVEHVNFSLRVHHTWPSGQIVRFVYSMLGKEYNNFNVPLLCLTVGSEAREVAVK